MTKDDREIVSAVLAGLADKVGTERCEWWFSGVQLTYAGECLRVLAADEFTLDQLRRRFRHELNAVAHETVGSAVRIEYLAEPLSAGAENAAHVEATEHRETPQAIKAPTPSVEPLAQRLRLVEAPAGRARPTLETFIAGEGNRLAFTAVQRVLRNPGSISPLYLHGPSGCGKSHLLQGMAAAARGGGLRVVQLTAEQFTSSFVEAVRGAGLPNFRAKYRGVDVLLLDDIQFFHNKKATLGEFQHTLDDLLRRGKQLVLAADRPPAELGFWSADVVARITAGVVCPIEPADLATRRQLAAAAAASAQCEIPPEVADLLAARLPGDPRLLQGAVNRLETAAEAYGAEVNVGMAEQCLADYWSQSQRAVSLADIRRAVCEVYGLEEKQLEDSGRTRRASQPRMLAMWLARKYTRAALSEIGDFFGGRTHTTVLSAQKRVAQWIEEGTAVDSPALRCAIAEAVRRIESKLTG